MNILIYENNLNGHRLEYIHHIYDLASRTSNHNFFFVVASNFDQIGHLFQWKKASNIIIDASLSNKTTILGRRETLREMINRSKEYAKNINYYIKKYDIDRIFAISIILYIPLLYKYLNKKISVDGILYSIFPSSNSTFPFQYIDYVKYAFFALSSRFCNIYILNDLDNALRLNKIYHTSKFKFIPDPFSPPKNDEIEDLRNKLSISHDKTIFLHFGGLQKRKGTMLIMDSIRMLSKEEKSRYAFIFAGKVYDDIKAEFYNAYEDLKNSVQIYIKDEFCSYEYLADLCQTCDCILIPYLTTTQSSGLIGYSSYFQRPVISPRDGLIGQLVKTYSLGYILPETNSVELIKAYKRVYQGTVQPPSKLYCEMNNIKNFQNVISSGF